MHVGLLEDDEAGRRENSGANIRRNASIDLRDEDAFSIASLGSARNELIAERVKNRKPFPALLFAFGLFLLVVGINAPSQLDKAVDEAVWNQLRMDTPDTSSYKAFVSSTGGPEGDHVFLKFRVYDIVNPDKKPHERFRVVERGPFVYRLTISHLNATLFGDHTGDSLRRKERELFYKPFQQVHIVLGGPNGGLDDSEMVTQISMPYQAILAISKMLPTKGLQDLLMNYFLGAPRERKEKLFVTRTVREILFGYREDFESKRKRQSRSDRGNFLDTFYDVVNLRKPPILRVEPAAADLMKSSSMHSDHGNLNEPGPKQIVQGYLPIHDGAERGSDGDDPAPHSGTDEELEERTLEELPLEIQQTLQQVSDQYALRVGSFRFEPSPSRNQRKKKFSGIDYPGFVQNFSTPEEVDLKLEFDGQRVDRQMMHTFSFYQGSSEFRRCSKPSCPLLWNSRDANRVLGSDSKYWGGKDHLEKLVFLPELVRSAPIVPDNESRIIDGIRCMRWRLERSVFSNMTLFPDNADYFGTNQLDGLFNVGPLLLNIPVFASKPRYLHADPALREMVEGIPEPNEDEHDCTFDVHEETGISVLVSQRFQYVVKLFASSNENDFVYMPVFWMETIEHMSKDHSRLFRRCDSFVEASQYLKYIGTVLGILCIVLGSTIATDRAEKDARRMQAIAAYDNLPIHNHHSSGRLLDDEEAPVVPVSDDARGMRLLWESKSLRSAWMTNPPFVLMINIIIEIFTLKQSRHVGVWHSYSPGESSAAVQLLLTALFVGIFVSITGVSVARGAFIRGEVPRRRIPFKPFHDSRKWLVTLPWRFTDHACGVGVLVGISFVIVWGGSCLLLMWIFVCGSPLAVGTCTLRWIAFTAIKSIFAAIEATIVFPMAALRALDAMDDEHD